MATTSEFLKPILTAIDSQKPSFFLVNQEEDLDFAPTGEWVATPAKGQGLSDKQFNAGNCDGESQVDSPCINQSIERLSLSRKRQISPSQKNLGEWKVDLEQRASIPKRQRRIGSGNPDFGVNSLQRKRKAFDEFPSCTKIPRILDPFPNQSLSSSLFELSALITLIVCFWDEWWLRQISETCIVQGSSLGAFLWSSTVPVSRGGNQTIFRCASLVDRQTYVHRCRSSWKPCNRQTLDLFMIRLSQMFIFPFQTYVAYLSYDMLNLNHKGGGCMTKVSIRTGIGWVFFTGSFRHKLGIGELSLIVCTTPTLSVLLLPSYLYTFPKKATTYMQMEELAKACNELSLHPAETKSKPPVLPAPSHDSVAKTTIVGKLFHTKSITPSALFRAMANVWHLQGTIPFQCGSSTPRPSANQSFFSDHPQEQAGTANGQPRPAT